jgi:hypothetical protein
MLPTPAAVVVFKHREIPPVSVLVSNKAEYGI